MNESHQIVVVGAGISGLTAALSLAEQGKSVLVLSEAPAGQAASALLSYGWNAVLSKGRAGDSVDQQLKDIQGMGAGLSSFDRLAQHCKEAASAIPLLERLGVYFERSPEGFRQAFKGGSSSHKREYRSVVSLGHQVHKALMGQAKSESFSDRIEFKESCRFLSLALDEDQRCHGVIYQELSSMQLRALSSSKVIVAAGGMESLYGDVSLSAGQSLGGALGALYRQGAFLVNTEFLNLTAWAVSCGGGSLALPQSWLTSDLPFWIQIEGHLTELDLSKKSETVSLETTLVRAFVDKGGDFDQKSSTLKVDLRSLVIKTEDLPLVNLIKDLMGVDIKKDLLPLSCCVQKNMGGLWVDKDFQTNLEGVYAVGDAAFQAHGVMMDASDRLPVLWSSALGAVQSLVEVSQTESELSKEVLETEWKRQQIKDADLMDLSGPENIYNVKERLMLLVKKSLGPIRDNETLQTADSELKELRELFGRISVRDKISCYNQDLLLARDLEAAFDLVAVQIHSALHRNESRGFHFKPDYPHQDDENYRRLTKVQFFEGELHVFYEEVKPVTGAASKVTQMAS